MYSLEKKPKNKFRRNEYSEREFKRGAYKL